MNKKLRLIPVAGVLVLLAGCPSPAVRQYPPPQQQQQVNQNLALLNELRGFKEELQQLRRSVETMQFENEGAKRERADFMANIERRIGVLEAQAGVAVASDLNNPAVGFDAGGSTDDVFAGSETALPPADDAAAVVDDGGLLAPVNNAPQTAASALDQSIYNDALDKLQQSRYAESVEGFEKLIEESPQSELVDDAYYYKSEAQYVNRDFQAALQGFKTVINQYPNSSRVPDAMLRVGLIQYDIGAYADAAESFRVLLQEYPNHEAAVTARTRLQRIEKTIQ